MIICRKSVEIFGITKYNEINLALPNLEVSMRSCFFVGHRDASEEIFDELADVIKRLVVEKEVTEFLVGNYGNFDRLAMRAVVKAKEMNPKIKLHHHLKKNIHPLM